MVVAEVEVEVALDAQDAQVQEDFLNMESWAVPTKVIFFVGQPFGFQSISKFSRERVVRFHNFLG